MTGTLAPPVPEGDIAFVPDQIEAEQRAAGDGAASRHRRGDALRPIMWRLHFLGGLLAGPVILCLCASGILFAWHPQIDNLRFGDVMRASSSEVSVSLTDQVTAAQEAFPDWTVYAVTPGSQGDNTMITMDPPGGASGFSGPADAELVYVDQATGEVTGAIDQDDTSGEYLRTLHSSLRLGPNAEPLTELAGSWFLVTLLTGLYLWWPGLRKRGSMAFAARRGMTGRRRDKDWHNFIGVGLLVPMAFLAVTGLTWTNYAGDRVDWAKDQLSVPAGGAEQALAAAIPGHAELANIDTVLATATSRQLVEPIEIIVPADDTTGWRVSSRDVTFPIERDQLTIDGTTGDVVASFDYRDEHWFNKLRTAAVLFHQAQLFGPPLQVFMTALALAIAYLVFLGYRMWLRRRPAGGMGAPPPVRSWLRAAPLPLLLAAATVAWLMPVLGLSLGLWLVIERGWRWLGELRGRDAVAAGTMSGRGGLVELIAATTSLAVGAAMIAVPSAGEGVAEPTTIPRLLIWGWDRPLGAVLLAVGSVGLAASWTRWRRHRASGEPLSAASSHPATT